MKNFIKISIITAFLTLASCSKSEDEKKTIEDLQPVAFVAAPDVVVKTELSRNAYPNPALNGASDYQLITTTQKTELANPVSPSLDMDNSLIFPGSILRGSSFLNGNYDPLVLSNSFNKVVLSTTIGSAGTVSEDCFPTVSGMRIGRNKLVIQQAGLLSYAFIPANYSYDSKEITTNESLVKSLNIHATLDLKFVAANVAAKFGYTKKETNSVETKYVLISFRQKLYSASIDPKFYTDWIVGGINPAECGPYEPVYISNVDYGRTAYVLFETSLSKEQLFTEVTASINASYGVATLNAGLTATTDLTRIFSQNSFKAYVYGGPIGQPLVTDLPSLINFLTLPTPEQLVASSAPIAYTVRRLSDNTKVEVRSVYTEETAAFRP